MEQVSLVSADWTAEDVALAFQPLQKLRGVRRRPGRMLLRTRSVHGFGLNRPLLAVGLSTAMEVLEARRLMPGRVLYFPGCRYVLELPIDDPLPALGTHLEVRNG